MTYLKSLFFLALLALASCSGGAGGASTGSGSGSSQTGLLWLRATDAPLDYDMVERAVVRIDKVRVHAEAAADSGFLTIYEGEPIELDLSELRNGVLRTLVQAEVPAGEYRQFRLHVSSAELELTNGNLYTTEDDSLQLSSQDTSGFKVFVDPPVSVTSQLGAETLLDFDLSKTFKPIPANDPPNATTFRLHPVIRAANLSEAGEVRGVVFESDGQGGFITVADSSVYVVPPGDTDRENSLASTATDPDGSYAILGLSPGTYDVLAFKAGLAGSAVGVIVNVGNVSIADIVLE